MKKATKLKSGSGRPLSRGHAAVTCVLLTLWFGAATVDAQTHTVTNCTEAALRAALAAGGMVNFACDGTISLSNTILIATNTVLDGSGHQVILSGGNTVRVFHMATNAHLTLVGLTVADGVSTNGGAVFNDGGTLTVQDVCFRNNRAQRDGGGAIFNTAGTVSATNSTFLGNEALLLANDQNFACRGGALLNYSGSVTLQNCVFWGNNARGSATFWHSGAEGSGGAVFSSGSLLADLCSFINNSASGGGGSDDIAYNGGGFGGGTASGGAIASSGTAAIARSLFTGNSAYSGSGGDGIYFFGDASEGASGGNASGGAVFNSGFALIQSSTFVTNTVTGGFGGNGGPGAGTYVPMLGLLGSVGGNGGNGGNGNGAALYNSGSANVVNTTVAFNSAAGGGGGGGGRGGDTSVPKAPSWPGGNGGPGGAGGSAFGGLYDISGNLSLTNCTVALNRGFPGGGAAGGPGGWGGPQGATGPTGANGSPGAGIRALSARLINSILAGNSASNVSGGIIDAGHNFSSDRSCAFTNLGSRNNTDPLLGPLADNGGPTPTIALLPGSPAIDAADNACAPATDQRGGARPAGAAVDIGAFEYGFVAITSPPESQTVEAGTATRLLAGITSDPPFGSLWIFNDTQIWIGGSNGELQLTNCQASYSGTYRLVLTNAVSAITSPPAMLSVIPPVPRRLSPAVTVAGAAGKSYTVEYSEHLGSDTSWLPLGSTIVGTQPGFCFDATTSLPQKRFYRASQSGTSLPQPLVDLEFVPAITLSGDIGKRIRLDYINAIGPIDAWATLDTVTLTNTSQLFFDAASLGQPRRLYRLVSLPSYATASPARVSGLQLVSHGMATVTSDWVTVSSSVTGTVTYRWVRVSGDSTVVPTHPAGATTGFTVTLNVNSVRRAVYQCTISGTGGPVTTNPVAVELSVESNL